MIYVLIAALICAIAFVAWRLAETRAQPGSQGAQRVPGRWQSGAPRGPDDDPEFLRSLDE
ncbi:hypothetical protein [Gordonia zhaorongruii]|uniref:hypothetical protein n=1 Tax=Gordonia zhaorongruii TaxID=2597659 RepID=UPI00104AF2B2|nr:hypothetical protein [Gordonia zhaorongruii]